MSKIALVAVALIVAGERKVFQPGERLPDLNPHDEVALLASKSIEDPEEEAHAERVAEVRAERAAQEFQRERERVQAEAASTRALDVAALGASTDGAGKGGEINTSIGGEGSQVSGGSSTSTAGGSEAGDNTGTTANAAPGSSSTQSPAADSSADKPPASTSTDATASTKPAAKTSGKNRS